MRLVTTEAIEFVKPCEKMAKNPYDAKIIMLCKDTTFPWRLDSVQTLVARD